MAAVKQKTMKLSEPVEFAGQTYTQLTFHRLKAKNLIGLNASGIKDDMERSFALAAAAADVDIGVIFELDLEDVAKMQAVLEDFFQPVLTAKQQSTPVQ
jgi:hypothetical protein